MPFQSSRALSPSAEPFIGAGAGFRFHEVMDDFCAPDVNKRDFVLIKSISEYRRDGYYLVAEWYGGAPCVYMCSPAGTKDDRHIRLQRNNPLYRGEAEIVPYTEFCERVLGKVVMTCKMRDSSFLPRG